MPTDALLSQELRSLIDGVSEQPATQRSEAQAEQQVNCTSDVAKGVVRRYPFEHVAPNATRTDITSVLGASLPAEEYKVHLIDLADDEQYALFLFDDDLRVFDLSDGDEKTVNDTGADGAAGSYTYLDTTTSGLAARAAFEAVTVGDTTFITNKGINTDIDGTIAAGTRSNEFLYFQKTPIGGGPNANTCYITIGALATVSGNTGATDQDSSEIVDELMTALCGVTSGADVTGTTVYTEWEFTRIGSNVLYGVQTTGTLVQASATDNHADTLHTMAATKITGGAVSADASVQAFSELPERAIDDFVIKVSGDRGKDEDDYYVKFVEAENVWKETIATGLGDVSTWDYDTMPHVLVYQRGTDDFDFGPASGSGPAANGVSLQWASRVVGDTGSAPLPSFEGFPIDDIFIHKNRLHFLADDNVISSESGEFFNFWASSATEVIDSDPYDIAATGNKVSTLDYGVPLEAGVSLFSVRGSSISELVGSRDEQLTVKNARVELRQQIAVTSARPAVLGNSIFFGMDRSNRSGIYEYTQKDFGVFEAVEISSHVPEFLPQDIYRIAASPAENMVAAITSDTLLRNQIYVYRQWREGGELVMASWSRWEIDANAKIIDIGWIRSKLYLFVHRQDGMHIEVMDFGKSVEHVNFPHRCHLDSQLSLTGVYAAGPDETTWTIPYDQVTNGGTFQIVTGEGFGTAGDERGQIVPIKSQADLSIVAEGDWSAAACYIGRVYESTYEFSEFVLRESQRKGGGAVFGDRLQLKRANLVYEDTGTFDVEVTSRDDDDADTYSDTFTSEFINQSLIAPRGLESGLFEFDITGNSADVILTVKSSSPLPFILSALRWEGRFFQRSASA